MSNRARQWMARAGAEYRSSARTWMVTFTMAPDEHASLDYRCFQRNPNPSKDELLRLRLDEFGTSISCWRRRMYGDNNKSRSTTSYLAVAELHDSERTSEEMRGRPHYHMLLHEKHVGALIPDTDCEFATEKGEIVYRVKDDGRARQLWPIGFTKFILCRDEGSAVYVCKYLHKEDGASGRVRASPRYGEVTETVLTGPPLIEGCRVIPDNSSCTNTGVFAPSKGN